MPLNLVEAGAAAGRSKSSILRAIKRGALSATRDDTTGGWCIEVAELFRAFPPPVARGANGTDDGTSSNRRGNPTIRELEARLEAEQAKTSILEETVADLRHRLDVESEERRTAQSQLTALLTDQRPSADPRPWWRRLVGR